MYKQRHRNSNYKSTAGANYAHIRYIATRPRVIKNESMDHGLFGKLEPGAVTEFTDWKEIAQLVFRNSKENIPMYRSIISFTEEVAAEIGLKNQINWKRYIENHILTIAERNNIKREHLQWACAVHGERNHPHIHIVFWDISQRIRNPFVPPAIPNQIRIQLIKDTFLNKIREYGEQKNIAAADMRKISDELAADFEKNIRQMNQKQYHDIRSSFDEEKELADSFLYSDKFLEEIGRKVFAIKSILPAQGRIAYQLLTPEVKKEVDDLVRYIMQNNQPLKQLAEDYVEAKVKMTLLYSEDETYLSGQKGKYQKEAEKIIANRILGMLKSINRLESERKSEAYIAHRREYFVSQMLYEICDMLSGSIEDQDEKYEQAKGIGELSKDAKKEYYLKNKDKGYEH